MKHLAEIIAYLPPEYLTIVVLAVIVEGMALTLFATLRSVRKDRLPLGASSGILLSLTLWLASLPLIILALLLLVAFGIEFWKELADAVQSAPN